MSSSKTSLSRGFPLNISHPFVVDLFHYILHYTQWFTRCQGGISHIWCRNSFTQNCGQRLPYILLSWC